MAEAERGESWQVHDARGQRKYLNAAERARFLKAAERLAPQKRALCYVLAFSGCRVSEALALTPCHVDAERMALTFRTLKRRRLVFRFVPVPQQVITMLLALQPDEEGWMFPLHRATAWRMVVMTMRIAGIRGPMASPKGLRHGFGIRAAGFNVPANLIQRWMGHARAETTAIYTDAVGTEERLFAERMWKEDRPCAI